MMRLDEISQEEIEEIQTEEVFIRKRIREALWGAWTNDALLDLLKLFLTSPGLPPLYAVVTTRCLRTPMQITYCRMDRPEPTNVDVEADLNTDNEGPFYGTRTLGLIQLVRKVLYYGASMALLEWQKEIVEERVRVVYGHVKADNPVPSDLLFLRLPLWQDLPLRLFIHYSTYDYLVCSLLYVHRLQDYWKDSDFLFLLNDCDFDWGFFFLLFFQDFSSFTFTPLVMPLASRVLNSFNHRVTNYTTLDDHVVRLFYHSGIIGGSFYGFRSYLKALFHPFVRTFFGLHTILSFIRVPLARRTFRLASIETQPVDIAVKPPRLFSSILGPVFSFSLFAVSSLFVPRIF